MVLYLQTHRGGTLSANLHTYRGGTPSANLLWWYSVCKPTPVVLYLQTHSVIPYLQTRCGGTLVCKPAPVVFFKPTPVVLCSQTHSGVLYLQTHSGGTLSANPLWWYLFWWYLYLLTHSSGALFANPPQWYSIISANPPQWFSVRKPAMVILVLYLQTQSIEVLYLKT